MSCGRRGCWRAMHARTHRPLRHDQPRHAAEEAEHPHMRANSIRQRLCEGRLRIGVAGGAEQADEEPRAPAFPKPRPPPPRAPPSSPPARTVAARECRRSARPAQAKQFRSPAPAADCPGSCCAPPPACGRSRARSPRHAAAATCIVIVAWSALSSPASPTSSLMRKGCCSLCERCRNSLACVMR